jgi:transposase
MAASKRRSAKEWSGLIRDWKRSGKTAQEFARQHRLRPEALIWWNWQLKKRNLPATKAKGVRKRRHTPALVRVQVEEDSHPDGSAGMAWELVFPTGHVLRVFERDAEVLREVVGMVGREGSQP